MSGDRGIVKRLRSSELFRKIVICLGILFPIITGIIRFTSISELYPIFNPYNFLWLGFYGTILVRKFHDDTPLNAILVILNIVILIGQIVMASINGEMEILNSIIKMLLPFIN